MPVSDVVRSRDFYTALGFAVKAKYSGEESTCFVVTEQISLMLSHAEKFKHFIDKVVATPAASEMILSFECDSEAQVRALVEKALSLGVRKVNEFDDNEFMFSGAFEDLDGHLWDLFWMKPPANEK